MRVFGMAVVAMCVAAGSVFTPSDAHAAVLDWSTCPAGSGLGATARAECATLTVPMSYTDPAGRQIQVMVSRIRARDPHRRRGAIFINPGGPGGEALDVWGKLASRLPATLGEEFDEISVEPRGLQWSTPLDCRAAGKPAHIPQGLPDLPDKLACEAHQPGYIDSITTEATARDTDAVRAALGEQRIDFFGVSAGTNLGSVYATLFPEHVDKLVLDSAVDPDWVWNEEVARETWAWQVRLDDLFDWIAANNGVYSLGTTRAQAYQAWADQVAGQGGGFLSSLAPESGGSLPAVGVPLTADQRWHIANLLRSSQHPGITQGRTFMATFTALYNRKYWPYLAQGMRELRTDPHNTRFLDYLAKHAPVDTVPGSWVFEAVTCNETHAPDPAGIPNAVADLSTGASSLDTISNLRRGGMSCVGWPADAVPIYPSGARLTTRPLLIESDHDPATPAVGAKVLAATMNAHVIRVTGGDHGHFAEGDPTLDGAVMRYLETGTVDLTVTNEVPIHTPNPPTTVP